VGEFFRHRCASGRISGGKPFARGALYLMLQNRIYRAAGRLRQPEGATRSFTTSNPILANMSRLSISRFGMLSRPSSSSSKRQSGPVTRTGF